MNEATAGEPSRHDAGDAEASGGGSIPVLSTVSPVRDEEGGLDRFLEVLEATLDRLGVSWEIILVDDGSRDDSWRRIEHAAERDPRIRGLRLSRNFGKDAAVIAGLAETRGDAAVVMDSDLQHPPAILPRLVEAWRAGAEVVEARKRTRVGQSLMHRVTARTFNDIFSRLTGVSLDEATDYRLLSRPAVDALLALPERALFFRATSTWIGFERETVDFDVEERANGRSRWSARALIRLALNGLTSFTAAPLHLVTFAGGIFALFSLVLGIQTLARWAVGAAVPGFTTVLLVILIQGTFVLLGLGIIGEYLARIHDEVKGRPRYVVSARTSSRLRQGGRWTPPPASPNPPT
jgi:polyisoprenyl-phosphate glycosyltransferase